MKIIFITRLFYPHMGGVEKHVELISQKLLEKGYDITVLTTKYDKKLKNKDNYKGIRIIRIYQPKIKFVGLIYTWVWLMRNINILKESGVLHIHDVFVWYFPFRYILPKKNFYITFHGWEGKYPIPVMNIIQKRLAGILSRKSISVGKFISRYYGVISDVIVYGAISDTQNKISKNKNSVIYIGRLDRDTGIKEILDFIRIGGIRNIEFCGDGEMKEEASKYGKVHGFVDTQPYYAKAKYCFASGYLTIMEAMASKCLVFVVYDNPLKKDYYEMTPFAKHIVIGKSSDDLVKKFKYYEENTKAAQKKIDKGYNWVKKQTWDKMLGDYLRLWGIDENSTRPGKN